MTKPIRILLVTDSPQLHTGLAETTRLVFNQLLTKYQGKYEIEQLAWFNFSDGPEKVPWKLHRTHVKMNENNQAVPDDTDRYGQRTFEAVLRDIKPDIVWAYGDLWCFDHILNSPSRNTFRLVVYYTIDGTPYSGGFSLPGQKSEWGAKLANADEIVVLTEFGQHVLKGSCPEIKDKDINVIYHPSDVNRFPVFNREEKLVNRKKIYNSQIPNDGFIMGWIGRNQFRKQNHKMWEVLHYVKHGDYIECSTCNRITPKEFDWANSTSFSTAVSIYEEGYDYTYCWYCNSKAIKSGRPISDVYLWMHTPKTDPGWNMDALSNIWDVKEKIILTGSDGQRGLPPRALAELVATWDAMLYLSGGEGFGVPAFEAMQSGVPIIYTNYSSHADFCKYGGLPVRCTFIPQEAHLINRSIADTGDAVSKVLQAYRNPHSISKLGLAGREFTKSKSVEIITDQWDTLFTKLYNKPLSTHGNTKIYSQLA